MLTPPNLADDTIRTWLSARHQLEATTIQFLPLGADVASAAFRITAGEGAFFLKLRRGKIAPASVTVPRCLADSGIAAVLAPLPDRNAKLVSPLSAFDAVLYPFVEGQTALDISLTPDQWAAFGHALRRVHDVTPPASIATTLRQETHASAHRDRVSALLANAANLRPIDAVAASFLQIVATNHDAIARIAERAGQLAATVQARALPPVVCHGDIHAANLMVGTDGALHIVDWDDVILAPRERDLMFIGAGVVGRWSNPQEVAQFFAGYGAVTIDPAAIAFYRYERIVIDIAEFATQLLAADSGPRDREHALGWFRQQFDPGDVVAMADAAYAAIA